MFYKVVIGSSSCLRSARTMLYGVEYKVNKWAEPCLVRSKLFVFSNLESAKRFKTPYETIFTCEVENPVKVDKIAHLQDHVLAFWHNPNRVYYPVKTAPAPQGTYLADRVKLLEEVCN